MPYRRVREGLALRNIWGKFGLSNAVNYNLRQRKEAALGLGGTASSFVGATQKFKQRREKLESRRWETKSLRVRGGRRKAESLRVKGGTDVGARKSRARYVGNASMGGPFRRSKNRGGTKSVRVDVALEQPDFQGSYRRGLSAKNLNRA